MTVTVNPNHASYHQAQQLRRADIERVAQMLGDTTSVDSLTEDQLLEMKNIVDKVPTNKVTSPLKTFVTVSLLTGASALGGLAFGKRIVNFLSKNTKLFESASKKIMTILNSAKKYVNTAPMLKEKNLKGYLLRTANDILKSIEKYSKNGIESELKAIKGRGAQAQRAILQGKNLISKAVGIGCATTAGATTVAESYKDKDGKPSIEANNENQSVKAAIAKAATNMVLADAA